MSDDFKDHGNATVIGHIRIRDPDTGEIILNKRDPNKKASEGDGTTVR